MYPAEQKASYSHKIFPCIAYKNHVKLAFENE